MASDFGASSPRTMWSTVIIAKAQVRLTVCSTDDGAPMIPTRSGSRMRAKAGSPIQPRARLASVIPSWVADR